MPNTKKAPVTQLTAVAWNRQYTYGVWTSKTAKTAKSYLNAASQYTSMLLRVATTATHIFSKLTTLESTSHTASVTSLGGRGTCYVYTDVSTIHELTDGSYERRTQTGNAIQYCVPIYAYICYMRAHRAEPFIHTSSATTGSTHTRLTTYSHFADGTETN